MEPSTAELLPLLVNVAGQDFVWTPERGLDPEVVLTVDRFVWRRALGYRRSAARAGLAPEDLYQEGHLAALRAAELFDPFRGIKFVTYAGIHIIRRMQLVLGSREVYIPTRERKAVTFPSVSSLEAHVPEGRVFRADAEPDAAEVREDRDTVRAALAKLASRDRQVIEMSFGIGTEERTLTDVGKVLGVTRQRAFQIQSRALLRLRIAIEARETQ